MSKKVKALFVVVMLSATFIILFQTCVITLDPRSCPMDLQRQYLDRYSNGFPLSLITARAPLWIHEKNVTQFTKLTQASNMTALLKRNGNTDLLRSSVDMQLTVLKLNSSSVKLSGTSSNNGNKGDSSVPEKLLASVEQSTPLPSMHTITYAHTGVIGESQQSGSKVVYVTKPEQTAESNSHSTHAQSSQLGASTPPSSSNINVGNDGQQNIDVNYPHTKRTKPEKQGSKQRIDGQSGAVGKAELHDQRPSLRLPPASSKQLLTHTTFLKQPQTQGTLLAQQQTREKPLAKPQIKSPPTPRPPKKQRRRRRHAVTLSATLPTGVSLALNLSSISHLPQPRIGTYVCQDRLCTEVLTPVDLLYLNFCTDRQKHAKTEIYHNMPLGKCHFIDGRNRAPVALVSFPGSGNTWVRGLLEQATGVCTGSIYCDVSLRASGFNGEGLRSGAVIVVKTHRPVPQWTESNTSIINERGPPKYGSGIVIIRNPFDALVAEWNREMSQRVTVAGRNGTSNHVYCVGREFFGNNPEWNKYITRRVYVWQNYFYNWTLNNMSKPILVVRFEDLKSDLIGQVKRMLDFLQFPYLEDELNSRLADGFGKFQRIHDGDDFEHFTANQRVFIRTVVLETIEKLRQHRRKHLFGLTDYLYNNL